MMYWLLGGYMWLYIHRPFEVWPILGILRLERVYMLAMVVYWLVAADKVWTRNRLNVGFGIFVLTMIGSWMASPYDNLGFDRLEDWLKIAVFSFLVITTVRDERALKWMMTAYLVAVGLYMSHSFVEYLHGRHQFRMGITRMIGVDEAHGDPNSFSATVLYSIPLLLPLWFEVRKSWQRWLLLAYLGLSIICVVLSGSRAAFVGLCFLGFLMSMLSQHRVKFIAALGVLGLIIVASMPDYLADRYLTLLDPSRGPKNAEDSARGRLLGLMNGIKLWSENPIWGAGPGAFAVATGAGYQAHSLYGQVLGEMGTMGTLGLVALLSGFAGNFREVRRAVREHPSQRNLFVYRTVLAISMMVLLLLLLGCGEHNLYRFNWLWFGAFEVASLGVLRTQAEEEPLEDAEPLGEELLYVGLA